MNGSDFLRLSDIVFAPFLNNLGFIPKDTCISGRFYQTTFIGLKNAVMISYEPGDEALFILIFSRKEGKLSNIDDRHDTPRLADLNRQYMPYVTKEEQVNNDSFFKSIVPKDNEERLMLKSAKELRLVLPKFLDNQDNEIKKT